MSSKALKQAVAYLRTSSAANVGADKDSERRQGEAVQVFARSAGYEIIESYYDAAVSGADAVTARPGFSAMLERLLFLRRQRAPASEDRALFSFVARFFDYVLFSCESVSQDHLSRSR